MKRWNKNHRFFLKKSFINRAHSSASIPFTTIVFGCKASEHILISPLWIFSTKDKFSCLCPSYSTGTHHTRFHCDIQSTFIQVFSPNVLAAAVTACISAWAVTSFNVSVRLWPRPMMRSRQTTTAPPELLPVQLLLQPPSRLVSYNRYHLPSYLLISCSLNNVG